MNFDDIEKAVCEACDLVYLLNGPGHGVLSLLCFSDQIEYREPGKDIGDTNMILSFKRNIRLRTSISSRQ